MPRAPIVEAGGALVVRDLLSAEWFEAVRAEGLTLRATAREHVKAEPDPGDWRSGNPSRRLASAEGGGILDAIYNDAGIAARIGALVGLAARPTGSRGTYSYYDRPGHFLGLHRDIRTCDVTLLICLHRVPGATPETGALRTYPQAMAADLAGIDATTPHRDVAMQPGDAVVLLGGCIPHEVLPADDRFSRAVGVMCFETTPAA